MDVRLKFQLTSAPLSSVGGRQAEFEEISEAGITSPGLIRGSKRPFSLWPESLGSPGAGGIEGMCSFVNTNAAKSAKLSFYLFMLEPIDIEFKDGLLIALVQHFCLH